MDFLNQKLYDSFRKSQFLLHNCVYSIVNTVSLRLIIFGLEYYSTTIEIFSFCTSNMWIIPIVVYAMIGLTSSPPAERGAEMGARLIQRPCNSICHIWKPDKIFRTEEVWYWPIIWRKKINFAVLLFKNFQIKNTGDLHSCLVTLW